MKYILTSLLISLSLCVFGQPTNGLVAYYPFDDQTANDMSGNGSNGVIISDSLFWGCGVSGDAMRLNVEGFSTNILLLGTVNNNFDQEDFTISLYFKSVSSIGTQTIISKGEGCTADSKFSVELTPTANNILAEVSESSSKSGNVAAQLDFGRCWHHLVVMRQSSTTYLYLNGELKNQENAGSRVDVSNANVLSIANPTCSVTDLPFSGFLDEVRIYSRALDDDELEELYIAPDRIANEDETIFLGDSVALDITESCPTTVVDWMPDLYISSYGDSLSQRDPTVKPTESITYEATFTDEVCIAFDTVRITVIDPATLDCTEIFLPKAFTPNGDNLNDSYGVSNPYAISNLVSLEIFDRWGGRVFFTDNPFEKWDGSFQGKAVNPGVMLYRVKYNCDGEERIDVGSVSIIR